MKFNNPEKFKQLPDAILFDTDNTLYHYDPAHAAAQAAVTIKVCKNLSISEKDFNIAYGKARHDVKERLDGTASSHSRLLYMQRMLEILGLGSQVLLALDFEQTYWRTFLSTAELFDDVKELLDDIRLLGIPIAIVTDLTAQIQFRKIVYFGLDQYFDCIVTSEEAGFDKPNAAPFQIAMKKLNPLGSKIWMIGDNPINDIIGAREAIGAITLQKKHPGVLLGTGNDAPDAVFENFGSLRKIIKSYSIEK